MTMSEKTRKVGDKKGQHHCCRSIKNILNMLKSSFSIMFQ